MDLVKTQSQEIDLKKAVNMLKHTIPSLARVSDDVIITAIMHAKHLNLDPLKREVHFVPFYNDTLNKYVLQLVVAYTEYIKRAEKSGKLRGWGCKVEKREDDYYAVVVIKRADWTMDFVWEVPLKEVKKEAKKDKNGKEIPGVWQTQPLFMLRKTAIAQAFRMCFPAEVSDLPYEEAEIEITSDINASSVDNVVNTNIVASIPEEVKEVKEQKVENTETKQEDSNKISEKQRKFLFVRAKQLAINENELKEIIKQFGYESTKDIEKNKFQSILDALSEYELNRGREIQKTGSLEDVVDF